MIRKLFISPGKNGLLKAILIAAFYFLFFNFVVNDKPLLQCCGKKYYTLFSTSQNHMDQGPCDTLVNALIPYGPASTNLDQSLLSPFSQQPTSWRDRHWLGTDHLGRDVTAMWLNGLRLAIVIGVLGSFTALIIGTLLGGIAGYGGNKLMKIKYSDLLFVLFVFATGWYALVYYPGHYFIQNKVSLYYIPAALFAAKIISYYILRKTLFKGPVFQHGLTIPFDALIKRIIEIFDSLPHLVLILVLAAIISKPGLTGIILLICLFRWPAVARVVRGETIRQKNMNYIEAGKALGISDTKIFIKHIIPNISPILRIQFAYGFASAVLIEASLSFLGIGLGAETVSWGGMLGLARNYPGAWWLIIPPGLGLFFMIRLLYSLGAKKSTL